MSRSILDAVQQSFAPPRVVSIVEFAESEEFCNTVEAPVWLADLTFKPIGEIAIGDRVVGWAKDGHYRKLCESIVVDVRRRTSSVVKVTMASGRVIRCTPDHPWLTPSLGHGVRSRDAFLANGGQWFVPAKVGRKLVHVVDVPETLESDKARAAAWLGGIFDGEGSSSKKASLSFAQSMSHNPEVCAEIERVLDLLGFHWTRTDRAYNLRGPDGGWSRGYATGRQQIVNFLNWCRPVRQWKVIPKVLNQHGWRTSDEVVSIEPDGEEEVVALTTTTGNYVAWGYASKNCGKPLYPLQRVLLKLIFLEELTNQEEDLLNTIIKGGRRPGDFFLSPNIRERVDYCRDKGYDHFTEVCFIGGRRGSKGHMTGLAMGKKLYDIKQIADPGDFFGIDPDKEIYFACVAASLKQAKERQFADLYSTITRCPPLARDIPKGKALEESISIRHASDDKNLRRMKDLGIEITRDFSKFRVQPWAANAQTVRGNAVASICMDEMAHMLPGESRSSAQEVYNALEPSLKQFGHHVLVFCNSSPWSKVGQFYQQALLAQRPIDHQEAWYPMRFALQWASWAIYDYWWLDKRWSGSIMVSPDWPDQLDPKVPESALDVKHLEMRTAEKLTEKANPETYRVEYRAQWAEVVDAYLNPLMVDKAYNGLLPNGETCTTKSGGGYHHQYIGHVDPSSTTAGFGYAMGHVESYPDPTGMFPDGLARHVVFDTVKRWNPKDFPGETINYLEVNEQLKHELRVFRPSEFSFDQFNSQHMAQELREFCRQNRMTEIRISIDHAHAKLNWERWEVFKTALNLGLVHIPPDCIDPQSLFDYSDYSSLELKFLQAKPAGQVKRIDKQDMGPITTKDIADCICIVTYKFLASYLENVRSTSLGSSPRFGAEGGFQIGGRQEGGPMNREDRGLTGMDRFYKDSKFNNPFKTRSAYRRGR